MSLRGFHFSEKSKNRCDGLLCMGGGPPTFPWVGVRLGSKKLSLGAVQTPPQLGVGVSLKGVQGSPGVSTLV